MLVGRGPGSERVPCLEVYEAVHRGAEGNVRLEHLVLAEPK